jgi:uncharacterized membrane protein
MSAAGVAVADRSSPGFWLAMAVAGTSLAVNAWLLLRRGFTAHKLTSKNTNQMDKSKVRARVAIFCAALAVAFFGKEVFIVLSALLHSAQWDETASVKRLIIGAVFAGLAFVTRPRLAIHAPASIVPRHRR